MDWIMLVKIFSSDFIYFSLTKETLQQISKKNLNREREKCMKFKAETTNWSWKRKITQGALRAAKTKMRFQMFVWPIKMQKRVCNFLCIWNKTFLLFWQPVQIFVFLWYEKTRFFDFKIKKMISLLSLYAVCNFVNYFKPKLFTTKS